jgi:hypothetical protein
MAGIRPLVPGAIAPRGGEQRGGEQRGGEQRGKGGLGQFVVTPGASGSRRSCAPG